MAKLTLVDITSGYIGNTTFNANNAAIEAALENTLSRDGTSPNQMGAALDMNSNAITNLPDAINNQSPATLAQLQAAGATNATSAALVTVADAGAYHTGTNVEAVLQEVGAELDTIPVTQAAISAVLWPITAAETAAGVTPTNYQYEPGNVLRYGTNTTPGTTDMSTAIQAALDANASVYVPAGTYACVGLTMDNGIQRTIYGDGEASILKRNANGDVLTISSAYNTIKDLMVTGDGTQTGDNIVISGVSNTYLYNVISTQTVGRCVFATGDFGGTKIIGGRFNLSSSAGALAPPIQLGTAADTLQSLYVNIQGANFNENDAPLELYYVGTSFISDCQIGGLNLKANAGGDSNGITVTGCRITGDSSFVGPAHCFVANIMSSTSDFTFEASANGCKWVGNTEPNSITNSGNNNNFIMRATAGAAGQIQLQFGDDSSSAKWNIDPTATGNVELTDGNLTIANQQSFTVKSVDGTDGLTLSVTGSDNATVRNRESGKSLQLTQDGTGNIQHVINGAVYGTIDATAVAGNTSLLLYDVDNATLERVTVGAADSGGAGYKVLRILN